MKTTQTQDICNYIMENPNGITSYEAIKKFGCTRLADVIYRLRRPPYNLSIITEEKNVKNRYGGISTVACYRLGD